MARETRRTLVVAACVALGACGGDSTPSSPTGGPPTPAPTPTPEPIITLVEAPPEGVSIETNEFGTPVELPRFVVEIVHNEPVAAVGASLMFRDSTGNCALATGGGDVTVPASTPTRITMTDVLFLTASCPKPATTTTIDLAYGANEMALGSGSLERTYVWP